MNAGIVRSVEKRKVEHIPLEYNKKASLGGAQRWGREGTWLKVPPFIQ